MEFLKLAVLKRGKNLDTVEKSKYKENIGCAVSNRIIPKNKFSTCKAKTLSKI